MLPLRVRVRGPRRLGMVATGSSPMWRERGRGSRTGWLRVGCWRIGNGSGYERILFGALQAYRVKMTSASDPVRSAVD